MPNLGDDYNIPLPEAEPFPEMARPAASDAGVLKPSPEAPEEEEPSSESAEAPLRPRRKVPKVLEKDETQELRNAGSSQKKRNLLGDGCRRRRRRLRDRHFEDGHSIGHVFW